MNFEYEYIKLKALRTRERQRFEMRINELKEQIADLREQLIDPYEPPQFDLEMNELLTIVSKATNITKREILGNSRKREIIQARGLFCYVAVRNLGKMTTVTGRFLNRDHSTVINHCKNYDGWIEMKVKPETTYYERVLSEVTNAKR
jgi:chromosomal replication initiation ATPase DnaA